MPNETNTIPTFEEGAAEMKPTNEVDLTFAKWELEWNALSEMARSLTPLEQSDEHGGYVAEGHHEDEPFIAACLEHDQYLIGENPYTYTVVRGYGQWEPCKIDPENQRLSWSSEPKDGYTAMTQGEADW